MRRCAIPLTPAPLLALLLALAGCGDDDQAFAFRSRAKTPTGDPVHVRYDLEPGEGVRIRMTMSGGLKVEADGRSRRMPMDVTMELLYRCDEVHENGDLTIAMEITAEGEVEPEVRGTLRVDRLGGVKDVSFEAADPETRAELEKMLKQPGFQHFIPFPEAGLRVGEALDFAAVLSDAELAALMVQNLSGITPELKGELVLVGTRDIGGERVADFAMNVVLNMRGTTRQRGRSIDLDVGMKIDGTTLMSTRTGMPVGSSRVRMTGRGTMESGDNEASMSLDVTMRMEATPL